MSERVSQPGPPAPAAAPRYQRSSNGLVGAMVVTVLAVLAFVGWRSLFRDDEATPVRAVDYSISLRAAREAGKLAALAPPSLPQGWKATSATYAGGAEPAWHLGLLTGKGKYVGIEEQRASLDSLVTKYVDENADPGVSVKLGDQVWRSWTDAGGDYALGRTFSTRGEEESVLVVGTAGKQEIEDLTRSLSAG